MERATGEGTARGPTLLLPLAVPSAASPVAQKAPSLWRYLRAWDAVLFVVLFLDVVGDALASSMLVLLLEQNFRASSVLARATKAAMLVFESGVMFAFGRALDQWPRDAPLLALTYTKPVGAAALAAVLALEWAWGSTQTTIGLTMVVLLAAYAPSEAFGSMAAQLTIKRVCEYRGLAESDDAAAAGYGPDEPVLTHTEAADLVRPVLFTFYYGVVNAAFFVALFIVFGVRNAWGASVHEQAGANRIVYLVAIAAYLVAAAAAWAMHRVLVAKGLLLPRGPSPSAGLDGEYALVDGGGSGGQAGDSLCAYDPCGWDCTPGGWRLLTQNLRSGRLWAYLGVIASLAGVYCLYMQLDDTQPQYMIRRFGQTDTFAVVQAANPPLLVVLCLVLPFVPAVRRLGVPLRLVVGTTVQALSMVWQAALDSVAGGVIATVQFSLGEALAMPLVSEYAMRVAPRHEEAFYSSMSTLPRIVARSASLMLSAVLLDTFCPDRPLGACAADKRPVLIWWIVTGIALLTPVALGAMWARKWLR